MRFLRRNLAQVSEIIRGIFVGREVRDDITILFLKHIRINAVVIAAARIINAILRHFVDEEQ